MQKRFSKKRQAILDCLASTDAHPTAEWVYEQLKPVFADLSLATVYRNLAELKAAGVIRSVGTYDDREHFDYCAEAHLHLVCESCGHISDAPTVPMPEAWFAEVENATGFRAGDAHLFGLCRACRDAKKNQ